MLKANNKDIQTQLFDVTYIQKIIVSAVTGHHIF